MIISQEIHGFIKVGHYHNIVLKSIRYRFFKTYLVIAYYIFEIDQPVSFHSQVCTAKIGHDKKDRRKMKVTQNWIKKKEQVYNLISYEQIKNVKGGPLYFPQIKVKLRENTFIFQVKTRFSSEDFHL